MRFLFGKSIRPFYDIFFSLTAAVFTGHAVPKLGFDITNLRGVIIATVLYVIAWIMQQAYKIKQEQDLTI